MGREGRVWQDKVVKLKPSCLGKLLCTHVQVTKIFQIGYLCTHYKADAVGC